MQDSHSHLRVVADNTGVKRIMIVDDDPSQRWLMKDLLKGNGHVFEAESVDAALELFQRCTFYLIIVDYHMPVKTGFDLVDAIKDLENKPKIIMMTSHRDREISVRAVNTGVDRFLEKPFNGDNLFSSMKNIDEIIEREEREIQKYQSAGAIAMAQNIIKVSGNMIRNPSV